MVKSFNSNEQRLKRHRRVRAKISGTAQRPRLNVFRSNKHIYAQLIDDVNGVTLAVNLFCNSFYYSVCSTCATPF